MERTSVRVRIISANRSVVHGMIQSRGRTAHRLRGASLLRLEIFDLWATTRILISLVRKKIEVKRFASTKRILTPPARSPL